MVTIEEIEIIHWSIGAKYHYPNRTQEFELKKVSEKGLCLLFEFACGHVVTDCVFKDLLPVEKQIKLF